MRVIVVIGFYCLFSFISFCIADDKIEWIDYCAKINKACKPPGVPDSENALPLLQQAAALYVKPSGIAQEIEYKYYTTGKEIPYSDLTEQQRKGFTEWHKANQPAWKKIVEASMKDHFWQKYQYSIKEDAEKYRTFKDVIDVPLEYMSGLIDILRMCESMTREYIAQGNYKKAVNVYVAIIKVACVIRHARVSRLEQLFSEAYMLAGYENLLDILGDTNLTKDDIHNIEKSLAGLKASIRPALHTAIEDMLDRSLIQNMFSIDRAVHKTIPYANVEKYHDIFDSYSSMFRDEEIPGWKVIAKDHANYSEVMHVLEKLEERNSTFTNLTPYQIYRQNLDDIISENETTKYYVCFMHNVFMRKKHPDIFWRSRLYHEAVPVVVALKRWQFDKGSYPQTLNELVAAGYIKQVPEDPFSNGKIKYQKNGADFLLYSKGHNMKDDGGTREIDEEHREKDWVFWPIENKNTSTQ